MSVLDQKLEAMPPSLRGKLLRLTYANDPEATRVLTPDPQICRICEHLHHLFVNRGGHTRCWECDDGFERAAAAMRRGETGLLR